MSVSSVKIFCDSASKTSVVIDGEHTHRKYNLPKPFVLSPNDPRVMVIGCEAVSFPLSFYTINKTNNVIRIKNTNDSTDKTGYIPEGNYRISELIDELNSLKESDGTDIVAGRFVFEYNTKTAKIGILKAVGSSDSNITFSHTDYTDALGENQSNYAYDLLGIRSQTHFLFFDIQDRTYYNLSTTIATPVDFTINLTFTTGISIRINNLTCDNIDTREDGGGGHTIVRIPIQNSSNSYLSYFNNSPFTTTYSNRILENLDVSVVDDKGNDIELNGIHHYNITFRVDFIEPTNPSISRTKIQQDRIDMQNMDYGEEEEEEAEEEVEEEEQEEEGVMQRLESVSGRIPEEDFFTGGDSIMEMNRKFRKQNTEQFISPEFTPLTPV